MRRPSGCSATRGSSSLVSLCGYYTLISFLLNAFAVPMPEDGAPPWTPSPGAAG